MLEETCLTLGAAIFQQPCLIDMMLKTKKVRLIMKWSHIVVALMIFLGCPSSPAKPPPHGRWICDESTKQVGVEKLEGEGVGGGSCRLECDAGFFTPQPVIVSCGGEKNWCTQSPGVACVRKDTCSQTGDQKVFQVYRSSSTVHTVKQKCS